MANLQVTIPDAALQRVLDAFASAYGWSAVIVDAETGQSSANPETKQQFARRKVAEFIKEVVRSQEAQVAAEAARQASIAEANSLNIV